MERLKISFSTLGCPDWTITQALEIGVRSGYKGVELRFLEGEASFWKLPSFQRAGLQETLGQIADSGLAVCCLDTSCRFDSPEKNEREHWIEEGMRMADLAAQLYSPGIRVFGDRINAGATRAASQSWIVDSLNRLIEKVNHLGVGVWLETHGDFSSAPHVQPILSECHGLKLVWDAASAFVERAERPLANGSALKAGIRHVHIKDLRKVNERWVPVLTGDGDFPIAEIRNVLDATNYNGFLSFEWEKKWHPEIAPPEIAIPHFANWFRSQWEQLPSYSGANR